MQTRVSMACDEENVSAYIASIEAHAMGRVVKHSLKNGNLTVIIEHEYLIFWDERDCDHSETWDDEI